MENESSISKSRRRLTTYGKASRDEFDFEVPVSPSQSETESRPKNEEYKMDILGSNRTRMRDMSRSPGRTPGRHSAVSHRGRGHTSSISAKPRVPPAMDSDDGLYEVPSSDEENNAAKSPAKPAVKRRRLPGKGNNGTLLSSNKLAGHDDRIRESTRGIGRDTPLPFKKLPRSVKDAKSLKSIANGSQISNSPTIGDSSKDDLPVRTQTPVRRGNSGSDENLAGTNYTKSSLSSFERGSEMRTNLFESKLDSRKVESSELARNHYNQPEVSVSRPKTPPIALNPRHSKAPGIANDLTQKSAFSFMSPSGLDFLGLDISGSQSMGPTTGSPARRKLKDKLTKRNGAQSPDGLEETSLHLHENSGEVTSDRYAPSILNEAIEESIFSTSQPESSSQRITIAAGPRRTYAASHRTFRKDESTTEDDILANIAETQENSSAGASRRIRDDVEPGVLQDKATDQFDMDDSDDGPQTVLRNIHELREAGANSRLHGETEAILDELESSNTSMRRNGLLTLLSKLEDSTFKDKFASNGLDSRLLFLVKTDLDLMSKILLAMALLRILATYASPQSLEQYKERKTLDFLETLLGDTETIGAYCKNRKSNLSKSMQIEVEQICKSFQQSSLWRFGTPKILKPQTISLQIIEYFTRYAYETGISKNVLPSSTLELLSSILSYQNSNGENISSTGGNVEFRTTLAILELSTLGHEGTSGNLTALWHKQLLQTTCQLVISSQEWLVAENALPLSLLMRLGLNLTNSDAIACTVFAQSKLLTAATAIVDQHFEVISKEGEVHLHSSVVDNLVLSLGFLINLAENSPLARDLFLHRQGSLPPPLEVIIRIFTSRWVKAFEVTSEQGSRESVPLGYLAVLLAFLSCEKSNRAFIESMMADGSLKHLIIAVDAFLSYHQKVAEELQGTEGETGMKFHFIGRVQVVLNQLKQSYMQP